MRPTAIPRRQSNDNSVGGVSHHIRPQPEALFLGRGEAYPNRDPMPTDSHAVAVLDAPSKPERNGRQQPHALLYARRQVWQFPYRDARDSCLIGKGATDLAGDALHDGRVAAQEVGDSRQRGGRRLAARDEDGGGVELHLELR